jgi:tRNA(fMet)-specific endonuclease VapC
MSLFVLDTDHLSLFRFGQECVAARVALRRPEEVAITIISVEEQLRAWYTLIRKARDVNRRARGYQGLVEVVEEVRLFRVLPFELSAIQRYDELRRQFPRLGKMDLSIAAITLEHQGVLVTRNRQDFESLPGLVIEDWSV